MQPFGVVFLLTVVAYALCAEYGTVSFTPGEGMIVPMEMVLHKHTMLSIPSKPKNYKGCYDRTINFHDFDKGLVALKEVEKKKCLVKPTKETFEENKKFLKEVKNGKTKPVPQRIEKWTIPKNPIPAYKVESHFGRKIAKFCANHEVYSLEQRSVQTSLKVLDRDVSSMCLFNCGACSLLMEDL